MKTVRQLLASKGHSILSVSPESTVYEALSVMADHKIGALLVLNQNGLVGIFSERDYAREVVLKGRTSRSTAVAEIMSKHVITVTPDNTVEECMNLMSGKRIRHLPVIENEKVVGILSIGDLVKEIIAHQQFLIQQLETYIQG